MLRTLRGHIPENGPDFENREKVKHLEDGIWELREQPQKGPKPRVYFFKDGQRVIVATEAFAKRDESTKPFIERAKRIRAEYFSDKEYKLIEIEELETD